jgi:hypothetical protein
MSRGNTHHRLCVLVAHAGREHGRELVSHVFAGADGQALVLGDGRVDGEEPGVGGGLVLVLQLDLLLMQHGTQ